MNLFHHDHRHTSRRHREVYAAFEIAYTIADFAAALLFLVGSILFLYSGWLQELGTWMFIVGSALFAMKPTIRLVREMKLLAMGDPKDVAERASDS